MPILSIIVCFFAVVAAVAITHAIDTSKAKAVETRTLERYMDAEVRSEVDSASREYQNKHFDELLEARVIAASETAASRARKELLDSVTIERRSFVRHEGFVLKSTYLVLEERLLIGELPLMGWLKHETKISDNLDEKALKAATECASLVVHVIGQKTTLPLGKAVAAGTPQTGV